MRNSSFFSGRGILSKLLPKVPKSRFFFLGGGVFLASFNPKSLSPNEKFHFWWGRGYSLPRTPIQCNVDNIFVMVGQALHHIHLTLCRLYAVDPSMEH